MRSGLAWGSAVAAALLASSGCDYWNNLIEEKTVTRASLDIAVVDAWTGAPLRNSKCWEPAGSLAIEGFGNDGHAQVQAPTGHYPIHCKHEWYHEKTVDAVITAAGAQLVVRLARLVGEDDWYPGLEVRIPDPGDTLRYPRDLDWLASPADDSGRFLYVWSFAVNAQLNRGPWPPHRQAPKEAYSPRFQARIAAENGIQRGPDTVTLKVYSLLNDPKQPELIGISSKPIVWARNAKPIVRFNPTLFYIDSSQAVHPRWKVDCRGLRDPHNGLFDASDSDGECRSVRLRAWKSASLPDFDTLLSCELRHFTVHLPLVDPRKIQGDTAPREPDAIDADGAEVYDNALIAEMVDDNGEKGSDTVHFRTVGNSPSTAKLSVIDGKSVYSVGDSVEVKIIATNPDGWFNTIGVPWVGENSTEYQGVRYKYNIPEANVDSFRVFITFNAPGKTQFWARVEDNCEEIYETARQTVQVDEARPH